MDVRGLDGVMVPVDEKASQEFCDYAIKEGEVALCSEEGVAAVYRNIGGALYYNSVALTGPVSDEVKAKYLRRIRYNMTKKEAEVEEERDSLELTLTPEFVVAMSTIAGGLEKGTIDWDKVKTLERPRGGT